MKLLTSCLMMCFSLSAFAAEVPGIIMYKLSNGELVRRNVKLEVPAKGQGEVILKTNTTEWRTTNFWSTTTAQGEEIFTAVFQVDFMGKLATLAFEGTYLKGTNELLYSGSLYKKEGHDPVSNNIADFMFIGGFSFNYIRQ